MDAITAVSNINEKCGKNMFELDIAGGSGFDEKEQMFLREVKQIANQKSFVNYLGLDLRIEGEESYKRLQSYDLHVFPSRFYQECAPGSIIDMFIAGVPTLSSDFPSAKYLMNKDNSFFFKMNNIADLERQLLFIYNNQTALNKMRIESHNNAELYSETHFIHELEMILERMKKMSSYNVSVLILSCDKNHDLYKWINRTCDCFLNLGIECVLVTENIIDSFDKRINSYATHNNNFDERFVFGVEQCKNDNVIVFLDDYYVHDEHLDVKLINWLGVMEKEQLAALRIASIKKMYIKKKKIKKGYYSLSRIQPYEIDFHPTIWNKKELLALIKNRRFSVEFGTVFRFIFGRQKVE